MPKRKLPTRPSAPTFFDDIPAAPTWPLQELFPLNRKNDLGNRLTVQKHINADIDRSRTFLIVTGFTSLAHIIDTFGKAEFDAAKKVRILLGVEPEVRGRKKWQRAELEQTIKEYWLERGISPFKCGAVVGTNGGLANTATCCPRIRMNAHCFPSLFPDVEFLRR